MYGRGFKPVRRLIAFQKHIVAGEISRHDLVWPSIQRQKSVDFLAWALLNDGQFPNLHFIFPSQRGHDFQALPRALASRSRSECSMMNET